MAISLMGLSLGFRKTKTALHKARPTGASSDGAMVCVLFYGGETLILLGGVEVVVV